MNAPLRSGVSAEHPFPGLRPFASQDHEYFFGREDHVYALYRLIDSSRFIAVVGSSGCGKSSLVRAGLLPLLDTETREAGGHDWLWRAMRPGDAPLQRLTSLLASLSVDEDPIVASGRRERIAAQLLRSSFGISEALADTDGIAGKSIVLVIDQFEELFRYAGAASNRTGSSGDEVRARDEAAQFVQLLLEASRAPSSKIHVMLTMRSDFIGDCARFHGLPEAVCAAQFLVPSLTRDQLDDVIRKPVEKAGATIDPQLVEWLLNDCGTEMDQLPVLQHCLSRLWEEAGKAPAATATPSDAAPPEQETGIGQGVARHLSLNHYRNIGEFADALSRHADEILKDLPGPTLQLAVEQIFSALSELDKEGRAIRRALRFSQLVAETGVDETTVRQVLDRFRAYDCSFLITSPTDVKEIGGATRIDVGHEALLRRWDKVSGRGAELGWLRAEQQAGERYRGLLAMAEGNRAKIPSHLVDERWEWWKAHPRTEQWAERYGGGFARVQRLLKASQSGQRIKRWGIAAAFAVVAATAVAMFALWRAAEHAQSEANTTRGIALRAIITSIDRLKGFQEDGTLKAAGIQPFLDDANETLQLSRTDSAEISEVEISLLLAVSEVKENLGDYGAAQELAAKAETLSEYIVKKYPNRPRLKHKLYASKVQVADQFAKNLEDNAANAEEKYRAAFTIAQQLAASEPGNTEFQLDVVSSGNKIGEIQQYRRNWQAAMDQYDAGLKIVEAANEKFPSPAVRREIASQKARIAQVLSQRNEPGDDLEALRQYRGVLAIQEELLKDDPANATLLSNVELTYRRIAVLLKDKPDEAQLHYAAAVARRRQLYEGDPGNLSLRTGLARDYTLLGDVLMQKKEWREASRSYNDAIRMVQGIVLKNRNDTVWQAALAELNVKRGDASTHRSDNEPWRLNDALLQYQTAALSFEHLANNPKAGTPRYRELFDVRNKMADIFRRQNKHKEALDAYQSASVTAERVATNHGIVDWQIELSVTIEEAGDTLRGPSACCQLAGYEDVLAYYQKALEVIESAAVKEPDNQNLQSRKSAITAKIEPLVNREIRAQ